MVAVTMFVDAISFASAHVVKKKNQTNFIPAKKYSITVDECGYIIIH